MKKYFCDRCGAEIELIPAVLIDVTIDSKENIVDVNKRYELCENCIKRVDNFITMEEKEWAD